jgi:4-diphosphocytidyl-2-C-methyl-D-erythritol kinase
MAWTTVLSPAKVNLFLELVGCRKDGYHDLDTVLAKVGLCDRLWFRRRTDDRIALVQRSSRPGLEPRYPVPEDSRNLVWQAIDRLRQRSGKAFGIDAVFEKNIPPQAGLGGGSGNAACTLVTVNRLMKLGLSRSELAGLAGELGSDVPFFLADAAARCTGRGERVSPLARFRRIWIVIGIPPAGLKTGTVFGHCAVPDQPLDGEHWCGLWNFGRLHALAGALHNRLQAVAARLNPWIDRMQFEFSRVGTVGHQMSGSGSAWFGLFRQRREAFRAASLLRARVPQGRFIPVATIRSSTYPRPALPD